MSASVLASHNGEVGFFADEGLEADGARDTHVAGCDGEIVHAGLPAPVVAGVIAVVQHDENVDRQGGQAGGRVEGDEAASEEALLVVGGYDHRRPG